MAYIQFATIIFQRERYRHYVEKATTLDMGLQRTDIGPFLKKRL